MRILVNGFVYDTGPVRMTRLSVRLLPERFLARAEELVEQGREGVGERVEVPVRPSMMAGYIPHTVTVPLSTAF